MRLPLATLEVFNAIAGHGSLRAAADVLGIKPSTVSHQLKALEEQLGTALFIRTTRSVTLTEAGRTLMRGSDPAFNQLKEAFENARATGHTARGTLKLAMPDFVFHLLVRKALSSFSNCYPEIELELSLTDALSDILEEGLHAGFRLGDRLSQDMVAVRLTPPLDLVVAASPAYLENNAIPKEPSDLLDHNCIRYRYQSSGRIAPWSFMAGGNKYEVDVRGNLIVNTLPAAIESAGLGQGLIYTFRDYCLEELEAGNLVSLLSTYLAESPSVFIYFPREYRNMTPLRLFIDHLKEAIKNDQDQ